MLAQFLVTLVIVAVGVALLGIKIVLFKNGRFPHIHVAGNRELRKRGVDCVESQDKQARKKPGIGLTRV